MCNLTEHVGFANAWERGICYLIELTEILYHGWRTIRTFDLTQIFATSILCSVSLFLNIHLYFYHYTCDPGKFFFISHRNLEISMDVLWTQIHSYNINSLKQIHKVWNFIYQLYLISFWEAPISQKSWLLCRVQYTHALLFHFKN